MSQSAFPFYLSPKARCCCCFHECPPQTLLINQFRFSWTRADLIGLLLGWTGETTPAGQPYLGSFRKCQDCEERQLFSLRELLCFTLSVYVAEHTSHANTSISFAGQVYSHSFRCLGLHLWREHRNLYPFRSKQPLPLCSFVSYCSQHVEHFLDMMQICWRSRVPFARPPTSDAFTSSIKCSRQPPIAKVSALHYAITGPVPEIITMQFCHSAFLYSMPTQAIFICRLCRLCNPGKPINLGLFILTYIDTCHV
jgi:hypothetical protein